MSDDASTLTFTWATATDTGRHRSINQDSVLAAPGLFVVADGMGGASGGEVASVTAWVASRPSRCCKPRLPRR